VAIWASSVSIVISELNAAATILPGYTGQGEKKTQGQLQPGKNFWGTMELERTVAWITMPLRSSLPYEFGRDHTAGIYVWGTTKRLRRVSRWRATIYVMDTKNEASSILRARCSA
jgi:hypothetical protein